MTDTGGKPCLAASSSSELWAASAIPRSPKRGQPGQGGRWVQIT